MNGEENLEILNSIVIPLMKDRRHRSLIYQQDGAPPISPTPFEVF
jgi:hypothetical protein